MSKSDERMLRSFDRLCEAVNRLTDAVVGSRRERGADVVRRESTVRRSVSVVPCDDAEESQRSASVENVEAPPPPSATGHRKRPPTCLGCDSLSCVKEWVRFSDLPGDCYTWLLNHGFFPPPVCEQHGASHMKLTGDAYVCRATVESGAPCRRKVHRCAPLLNMHTKLTVDRLFMFWAHVANNESATSITNAMDLNKNTVALLFDLLSSATYRFQESSDAVKFTKCAVDETYVGKRKYNRGRRARTKGHWFLTMTEVQRDGTCGRTLWKLVKKRDKATLQAIIEKHLVGVRSIVTTDCHKGYKDLGEICRHYTVNHRREYVTESGHHTNHAEGCHSVVKRFCLNQHHRYGLTSAILQKHISLQCVKFLAGGVQQAHLWSHRLYQLLCVVKQTYNGQTEHISEQSSDTVEEEDTEAFELPTSQPPARLTKKGRVDKRCTVRAPAQDKEKNPPTTSEVTTVAQTDDPGFIVRSVECKECLETLEPRQFIQSEVVYEALQENVQPGFFVVEPRRAQHWLGYKTTKDHHLVIPKTKIVWPLYYAYHWILCFIDPENRIFHVYDSYREYAHGLRKKALKRVSKAIYVSWKSWKIAQLKACDQQAGGSNDCGLFTIRNGLAVMGVEGLVVTRAALKLTWQRKEAEANLVDLGNIVPSAKPAAVPAPPKRTRSPSPPTTQASKPVMNKTQAAKPAKLPKVRKAAKRLRRKAPKEAKRRWSSRKRK